MSYQNINKQRYQQKRMGDLARYEPTHLQSPNTLQRYNELRQQYFCHHTLSVDIHMDEVGHHHLHITSHFKKITLDRLHRLSVECRIIYLFK